MPTLIMTKLEGNLDGSIKAKAMTFLQKLNADDTTPGLHIERIQGSADPRVRTGRVDQFWRAVLFRLDNNGESHYVVHGVWPHDKAIKIAERVRLKVNPINGLPQFEEVPLPTESVGTAAPAEISGEAARAPGSLLASFGRTRDELVEVLGIPEEIAADALAAPDEDTLLALAQANEGWLGLLLVDLATDDAIDTIIERMQLARPTSTEADKDILASLQQPAARTQFAFIDGQDELRRVIETGDFGAWRVFLHPEQRRYVDRTYGGPFRLSGGAGTGKTVVLIHRARRLAQERPGDRIVLTTFTTNLAENLRESLAQLDPSLAVASTPGQPGIFVAGIDSLASAVIRSAPPDIELAVESVLGEPRTSLNARTPSGRWRDVIETTSTGLSPEIANETFLSTEYALVVLPSRVRTETDYLRVRRPGRGLALDRAKRSAVWSYFAAYRAQGRIDGSVDFAEAAAIAAEHLDAHPEDRPADHVLVDETQDLSPSHLQLVRALAPEGTDDLFLAEDMHQRIYGARVVLGRYGIRIVGRSQRLTLNYRTTAQNLRYAMTILDGGEYVDLEEQPEATGYRSARSGPPPRVEVLSALDVELDAIVTHAQKWIGEGTAPETIAVLVQDRFQRDRVTKRLAESGVPARAVDRERPPTDRVAVMTMHRAKGTEFSKVILADVGFRSPAEKVRLEALDPSELKDAELRLRSLQYVAATRARDELVVLQRS